MLTAGVLLAICALAGAAQNYSEGVQIDPNDCHLTVPAIIAKNEYKVEVHTVITADGYILEMHRIRHGKNCQKDLNEKRPAILVMHGLLSSSADFVSLGPDHALAYILADACYDTWLGNARGNYYSRQHVSASPNSSQFWNFSWVEIGLYDLPAMIDYIIDVTGNPAIHYCGHSQGTTSLYVLLSSKLEYNKKILSGSMLAPVAGLKYMNAPEIRVLAPMANLLWNTAQLTGLDRELMGKGVLHSDEHGNLVCPDSSFIETLACNVFVDFMVKPDEYDQVTLNSLICHTPAGNAVKPLFHYLQSIDSGNLCDWNYGAIRNLIVYGNRNAPCYDLTKIDCDLYHYFSPGDDLTHDNDMDRLQESFPSSRFYRIPDDNFTHLDFAWSPNAIYHVYTPMIEHMNSYHTSD